MADVQPCLLQKRHDSAPVDRIPLGACLYMVPKATQQGRVKCRHHITITVVPTQEAIPEEGGSKKSYGWCWWTDKDVHFDAKTPLSGERLSARFKMPFICNNDSCQVKKCWIFCIFSWKVFLDKIIHHVDQSRRKTLKKHLKETW